MLERTKKSPPVFYSPFRANALKGDQLTDGQRGVQNHIAGDKKFAEFRETLHILEQTRSFLSKLAQVRAFYANSIRLELTRSEKDLNPP